MMFLNSPLRRLRKDSAPNPEFKAALRARLIHAQPVAVYSPVSILRFTLATAAMALVLFFGLSTYTYASSAVSEGSMLYPLKTSLEDVEGKFHRSPEAQARFRVKIMHRRMAEIAYRLKHDKALPPGVILNLAKTLDLTVAELREAKGDPNTRQAVVDQLRDNAINFLSEYRTQVELSDLSPVRKEQQYRLIDARLERLQ